MAKVKHSCGCISLVRFGEAIPRKQHIAIIGKVGRDKCAQCGGPEGMETSRKTGHLSEEGGTMATRWQGLYGLFIGASTRFRAMLDTAEYWHQKGRIVERDRWLLAAGSFSDRWNAQYAAALRLHQTITGKSVPEMLCVLPIGVSVLRPRGNNS